MKAFLSSYHKSLYIYVVTDIITLNSLITGKAISPKNTNVLICNDRIERVVHGLLPEETTFFVQETDSTLALIETLIKAAEEGPPQCMPLSDTSHHLMRRLTPKEQIYLNNFINGIADTKSRPLVTYYKKNIMRKLGVNSTAELYFKGKIINNHNEAYYASAENISQEDILDKKLISTIIKLKKFNSKKTSV